ncbi:MAG: RNA polymerase sigma factor, partial [Lachnospiraceae bacterium]|nr:RNA polymerase sigma factor [Lachnospiraceae bacterium]
LDPLIDKYYQEIFRFCYYRTGNEQTAYDCTQDTFLRMLRFLDNYVETHKFKNYLLRIALNVCRDYYRTNSPPTVSLAEDNREQYDEEGRFTGQFMYSGEDESEKNGYEQIETSHVIQKCLLRLPEFQREVIILHFYYGYKVREIAKITGVSLPTAKSRLKQGLDKLKKCFREEGIHEENW